MSLFPLLRFLRVRLVDGELILFLFSEVHIYESLVVMGAHLLDILVMSPDPLLQSLQEEFMLTTLVNPTECWTPVLVNSLNLLEEKLMVLCGALLHGYQGFHDAGRGLQFQFNCRGVPGRGSTLESLR